RPGTADQGGEEEKGGRPFQVTAAWAARPGPAAKFPTIPRFVRAARVAGLAALKAEPAERAAPHRPVEAPAAAMAATGWECAMTVPARAEREVVAETPASHRQATGATAAQGGLGARPARAVRRGPRGWRMSITLEAAARAARQKGPRGKMERR